MTELTVENIHKTLGALHILKGASFTGEKGQIIALLGASGSGKTTLLRTVAGLEAPEEGRIVISGNTVFDGARGLMLPPERRNIGLVFQSYALWPHRTVAENVGFGLKIRGASSADIARRVQEMLQRMGLGALADRYPYQLSGGQQQRVAICRALVYEPRVILLDEPLSNLDAKLREEARYWIRKLILELELCAVAVTHDQSEALAMADKILLLKDGAIVQSGTPLEIYGCPTNRYAAEFLGNNNLIAGAFLGDGGRVGIGGPGWSLDGSAPEGPAAGGAPATAVVRVEHTRIVDGAGPNRIPLELEASLYLGAYWEYRLSGHGLSLKAQGARSLPAGPVWCEFPRESVWIFPSRDSRPAGL
ncbi:MAG: transporter related protein [Microvirga sp.]|jgi:iron(III) transport system ATP-binding protein|nr:transporter related protein [Microvirga sp.]